MRALVILAAFWSATPAVQSAKALAERSPTEQLNARLKRSRYQTSDSNYTVRLETTKGAIAVAVHRDWAPRAADRFHELVTARYYDDSRFFRVVKGQWAQFGIAADPKLATAWRTRTFADDPRRQSNTRGRVAFAFAVPNGRTTQVYISLRDNSYQDEQGFVPFGEVIAGMDVADALNGEYGESAGGGIRGGRQQPLFDGGNAFLDREFPRLDRLLTARVLG
jgi:cyclophilin family peptidyl-prolyl cis-trans isomerase